MARRKPETMYAIMRRAGYLSAGDLADTIGCSRQRVYNAIKGGRMKSVKIGSTIFLESKEIESWLQGARPLLTRVRRALKRGRG